ncbi:aryl hydrocarbon receptor 1b isoform X2 [Cottoperca gobio]|uniref:Aryl hydrocarbon receptor n=1 Tax=Cottoperca gobio TaxID=56716 RepID=A0A6J2QTW5_COTGO|nr:aryl hydrocarbon receptor-like isoform X2 [Cottoperca gobio]
MYAGRKRRKPAQKGVKPTQAEGAKSNPSKRHRDRLNSELDRLASLLPFPEDVISSLDKLSILRLSVSFLRTKNFFSVTLKNQLSTGVKKKSDHSDDSDDSKASVDGRIPEGELLLQALNGFILVVTAEGIVFFCSHTIQDYIGFHQTDVMHQSVFDLIHTEDQQEFRSNLHWALNPPADLSPPTDPSTDGDSVLTTSCLALNIQGRLKFLHGQSRQQCGSERSTPPQLALFAIATPLQPPAILEIRTRNMIFRTKHKLDFTPMACDAKGKIVLGYTEAELRVRGSGYQFIHAADMLYCAENHVRMIKTGESGLTVFRLLTKENRWKWVHANARLVYKNGKPDYIIATQRPLVDEEGGEHLRKRSMHLPFTFATGEATLYQTGYPLHGFPDSFQGKAKGSKSKKGKLDKSSSDDLDPKSLLGALMSQDESVYVCQPDTEPKTSYHSSLFTEPQGDSDAYGGMLSGDSWHMASNGETGRCNSNSYDPLLATLDSLSLDGEETCSNSELFSALENLGLNAEDLELLLLDERMIQVELGPNHVPSLSDLLTNNEILSYIHDSLESGTEGDSTRPSNPDSAQQACLAPAVPPALPIIQLSQQMQQHISAREQVKAQHTQSLSQPGTVDTKTGIPNGHWVVSTENHHPPHTILKASQLNGEHKHLHSLLESSQQWQLEQDQHSLHLQSQSALLPGFHTQLTTNGSYLPNGHTAFPPNVEVSHAGYNIANAAHAGGTALSGVTTPDVCHYQSLVAAARPYQQVPPSCLSQCPTQSSALELEELLGLSQPQHSLPSLEAYSMFNTAAQDSPHSKLENGCLLAATNAAYIRTCLMPNGNGVATRDIPDGLPALQDPQKSGFFL